MEKSCEFCTAMRPVVYCQADSAYLCLSCDAKVHSANGLSNRHLRTLLCNSCRSRPACSRCMDHQMFICWSCDRSLHGVSSQHRRRLVSSYVGCPPAKDFAALWGFELDNMDRKGCVNCAPACGLETEIGSSSQQSKPEDTSFILQQILDLKKLQLNEANSGSLFASEEGQEDMTFSTQKKHDDNLDRLSDLDKLSDLPIQQLGHPFRELKVDVLTSAFSQTEPSPFTSANTNPLVGESFWQSISPGHMNQNQMWSQNMQDIGVCDEIVCHENFNIPDVDISFSNFEELFRGDEDVTRALHNDRDVSCSAFGLNLSLDKSKGNNGREKQESSAASIYMHQSENVQFMVNQAHNIQGSPDEPQAILRPSYSALSFAVSRDSTESIGTEFLDSGLSPCIARGKAACLSYDMEASPVEVRGNAMTRYKEKKKTRRHENQVRRYPRRPRSDIRKRAAGKFVNTGCDDSDSVAAARTY